MNPELGRDEIEVFRGIVSERLGFVFEDDRLEQLADVLRKRLQATGCVRFPAYQRHITSAATSRAELRALASCLTVGETYFFRHPDHFRVFSEIVLPAIIAASDSSRQLRILSAGCASGEEPYTLAALVQQHPRNGEVRPINITGLDVNADVLEKARSARYSEWSFRATSEAMRKCIFRSEGRESVLVPDIRSMVTFVERNLVEEDSDFWRAGAFDVIFCRNVTMYFSPLRLSVHAPN